MANFFHTANKKTTFSGRFFYFASYVKAVFRKDVVKILKPILA